MFGFIGSLLGFGVSTRFVREYVQADENTKTETEKIKCERLHVIGILVGIVVGFGVGALLGFIITIL